MGVWRVMMVVVMIVAMAVIVVMIMVVMVMVMVIMPHRLKPAKPCAERITERAILYI